MLFQTTPEHEALRAKIRAFAEEEIKPIAFLLDQQNEFPEDAVRKLGEMGLMGIPYPKEYGGAGIGHPQLCHCRGGAGPGGRRHRRHPVGPCVPGFLAHLRFWHRGAEAEIPGPPGQGDKIGAFRLTEPNAGSDAGGTETTAVRKGDHYILNGGKIFITNAPKADTYVVFAVTTPDIGTRGISAFIVEKGWKGFYFWGPLRQDGHPLLHHRRADLRQCGGVRENLLGEEGQGFKIAMATLDGGRIGVAAQALGLPRGLRERPGLRQGAGSVRQARGLPAGGSPFKLADMAASCAVPASWSTPLPSRRRPMSLWDGGRHGKDVCLGHRPGGHQRRFADPRRGGLHERYGGGAGLPGRQDHHHLRGHQREPSGGHRLPYPGQGPQGGGRLLHKPKKPAPVTGVRKQKIFRDGTPGAGGRPGGAPEEGRPRLHRGHPHGHPPINQAERVVSAGKGMGSGRTWPSSRTWRAAGAAVGSSVRWRETLKYLP